MQSATTLTASSSSSFSSTHRQLHRRPIGPKKPIRLRLHFRCCAQLPPPPNPLLSTLDWVDSIKESGMRRRRPLYTPETWREHRSSRRHLRHVLSSLSSRVILSLIPPVTTFTAFAAAVAAFNSAVDAAWLPACFPLLRANPLPYQLTAPALALLLVFRTEASYGRYVEGRKAWMSVMAGTSEMATMVMALKISDASEECGIKKALLGYILAFPVALKCHVMSCNDATTELKDLLEKDDLSVVLDSKHRPHCIVAFISQSLQMIQVEETKRSILESKISYLHEGIGICEHLMGIPIPLSYTRLTSRFLVFWHLTLPIILWDDCNWIVVPATFVSAAALFCIEEVGVLIEEPFPMLALDEMCRQVHSNIRESMMIENSVRGRILSKRKRQIECDSTNGWPKY